MRSHDSPGAPRRRACPPPPGGDTRRALARAAALVLLASLALTASAAGARLPGSGLADYVRGTKGPDRISLRGGDDRGFGGGGADWLSGGPGDDRLRGGRGRDRAAGNAGADALAGGPGADRLRGGPGDDLLDARDDRRDAALDGGPGRDICLLDEAERGLARGCEAVVGPDPPNASTAFGIWAPGPRDTCPRWLHDAYAVTGPDGKLYPAWHPPRVTNPATGGPCTFGHEHGRDPAGSDLAGWVGGHLAGGAANVPFGVATEALDAWAAANPGYSRRHEDHVGHKVEWENDVELERGAAGGGREGIGVRCDFLVKVHQGTHSADALGNNAHELLYAVRCDDGTELLATKLSSFGAPNGFVRSCDKATGVAAGTSHDYPAGGGARLIPDRACVEEYLLVPAGGFSQYSLGLYEDWLSSNHLRTAAGRELAYFDPHFAVFNPSRYSLAGGIGRTLDVCFESEPGTGDIARGGYCEDARVSGQVAYDDPLSGFDGAHREVYFNQTEIANAGGPSRWWTDPYGGNASPAPFPGGICQIVAPRDNRRGNPLESQAFGAGRDYGGSGVHAPN
ncbi:MAG: hypothetical protein ACXWFH_11730 [Solirubrobacterales bacterium]